MASYRVQEWVDVGNTSVHIYNANNVGRLHTHVSRDGRCTNQCALIHRAQGSHWCPSHAVRHRGPKGEEFNAAFAADRHSIQR